MNKVYPDVDESFYALSHHSFSQFFTELTPATPHVIFGGLLFTWFVIGRFVEPLIYGKLDGDKVTSISEASKIIIYQKLDSYWNVLSNRAKDSWIKEEIICIKRINMKRMKPESF